MTSNEEPEARTDGEPCRGTESSCAQGAARKRNPGTWATTGSLVSAVLASACCWLPLLAVAVGASAAGVGAVFHQYRPYFLAAAAVLLGAGFYFLYLRKERCEPDDACAAPNPRARRFSQVVFWTAVLFIGAFAFFPSYVGYLLGGTRSGSVAATPGEAPEVTLALDGLTCEGCAANVRNALEQVDGVRGVDVDYATKRARVMLGDPSLAADAMPLLEAVERAGYQAKVVAKTTAPGASIRRIALEGMTCEACAAHIRAALDAVPGVAGVEVSYGQSLATVRLAAGAKVTDEMLLQAVSKAGYRGSLREPKAGADR